jgi:membrane-associated phospholipid phosphatase
MDNIVKSNFVKLKPTLFLIPIIILLVIVGILFYFGDLNAKGYVEIQKPYFYLINSDLSQFPATMLNLTQLGDAMIMLSFFTILIVYAPKFWEALLTSSLLSLIPCGLLKNLFAIPRPAAVFDHNSFTILGKVLTGHNSLPSGHSITIFTVLTVSMFAFLPKGTFYKIVRIGLMLLLGYAFSFTRVGVGAHYPLDVITGSVIGFMVGLTGIFITRKYNIWSWLFSVKFYPIFILAFSVSCFILVKKILHQELFIYYLAMTSLLISIFKLTHVYFKKTFAVNSVYDNN